MKKTYLALLIALLIAAQMAMPAPSLGQVRAEAIPGEPFGVGRVEVVLPERMLPEALGIAGLGLAEANGRVLYPAVDAGLLRSTLVNEVKGALDKLSQAERPAGRILGEIGRLLNPPPRVTIYFLFQGDGPLELTLQTRRVDTFVVTPSGDRTAHARLFDAWWRQYTASSGPLMELLGCPDYPPQVENYLKAMLARRLGLPLPQRPRDESFEETIADELGLLLGTESIRVALERDRFLGPAAPAEKADQPLPKPVSVPELQVPEPPENVAVEPLAARVPAECLYVRFGSFSNFIWLQDTLGKWRGDLANLIALRGLNYEVKRRIEQSLVIEMSVLGRLVGDAVVSDVAILGTDAFFQEGGAFGVLFHARNNLVLAAEFMRQRHERLQKGDGVVEEKVTVEGREVSLLSSPDGSVRSYYVVDGQFHFFSRSEALMKRFLETGSGKGALGASKEFRYARSVMPLDREDTVFVYLSDAFFRNFVGPRYRVETVRRIEAMADIELVQLALLASAAEEKPGGTIEQLVAGGFLPPNFGVRADGSRTVLADGEVYDSVRGRRGAFVPVSDVEFNRVSPSEADAYQRFCQFYHSNWQRLDPISVGIKRHALEGNRERVVIDARMTPFSPANYQRVRNVLGPPDSKQLAAVPDDGVALEVVFTNQRVFGGLREIHPPSTDWIDFGLWRGFRDFLVGYVGTTGELGRLSPLNVGITGPPNDDGYSSGPAGRIWRRDYGEFTLFSLQPDVLATVSPELRFEEAERPAQIRLRIDDVSHARTTPMLNNIGYARARETCLGNLRLMHDLTQQLHVPGELSRDTAELLLDAKLVCPLGGEYVLKEIPAGPGFWTSTGLVDQATGGLFTTEAPEGFVAPPLSWFRGLELDAAATPEAFSVHAEIVMQSPEKQPEKKD
ncbi:MAG: hypothetical protein ABIP48_12220 [Planctomycetota bacterium]